MQFQYSFDLRVQVMIALLRQRRRMLQEAGTCHLCRTESRLLQCAASSQQAGFGLPLLHWAAGVPSLLLPPGAVQHLVQGQAPLRPAVEQEDGVLPM